MNGLHFYVCICFHNFHISNHNHGHNVLKEVISALLTSYAKVGDGPYLDWMFLDFEVNYQGIWLYKNIFWECDNWLLVIWVICIVGSLR